MAEAITCDTKLKSTQELERGSYVLLADGSYAKRILLVDMGDGIDCPTSGTSLLTMKRGSYVELSPGQYAQQVADASLV